VRTLSFDIGGSKVKAMILNDQGEAITERERVKTPDPATPEKIIPAMEELASKLGAYDRISIGFPGAVRHGITETAPNLDEAWNGFPLGKELSDRLGKPTRVANDATVQGYGVMTGEGVELILTLGTGLGTALFIDGVGLPNFELAHHPFQEGKTYEELLGKKAMKDLGKKKWNKYLEKALEQLSALLWYDTVALGGGNAEDINFDLPENARIIPNIAGILGGVGLWRNE
jgi:polyphosphate glucokinase